MTLLQAILLRCCIGWQQVKSLYRSPTASVINAYLTAYRCYFGDPVKAVLLVELFSRCIWHSLPLEALCRWTKKRKYCDDYHGHNGRHIAGSGSGISSAAALIMAQLHSKAFGYGLDGTSCG